MAAGDFTLADVIAAHARQWPDRAAFVEGNRILNFGSLALRSCRLAASLHAAGVEQGDRIAVLSPNCFEFVLLICAAARLGAIICGINWRLSAAEVRQVLDNDQPKLVFVDDSFWHLLEPSLADDARKWKPVALQGPRVGVMRFDHLEAVVKFPVVDVKPHDPLLFVHTAWTDGRPRAAMLSHQNLLAQALQLQAAWGLTKEDTHLCALPLFHATALALMLATLLAGGCSVLLPKFEPAAAVASIAAHRVTLMGEFAPMLESILGAAVSPAALGSLRHVCGLDSEATITKFEEVVPDARFWNGFGQSETSGLVTLIPFREAGGSAGRPLALTSIDIVDEEGAVLPAGQQGEITVRGPCTFLGYWRRSSDTEWALRNGMLHTGDAGKLDAQGRLHYLGRLPAKELIKTGGENVYPAEVEAVLRRHPGVSDVAVIGVEDAVWGESVRAVCVVRGAAPDPKDLIAFVGEEIAHFKRPRSVVFAEVLPRLADGKHDRGAIKQRYGQA